MATGVTQNVGARVWWGPALVTAGALCMHALPGQDVDVDSWWTTWHMDKVLHLLAFSTWGLVHVCGVGQATPVSEGVAF